MTTLPFLQVDVFTDRPFRGNPVAVVLDADGIDGPTMQRIARWTNLSETTFVCRPTDTRADYALRIFTPETELPFAGHPTLGSARALLQTGRATPRGDRLVQQCGAGLVTIRAELAAALGLVAPPRIEAIDLGPIWLTAALPDAAGLLALEPDMAALAVVTRRLQVTGVTLHAPHRAPAAAGADLAVRSFAPGAGVPEDPVCGSGNACVAIQRRAAGTTAPYVASQGEAIGRAGRITVVYRGETVEVGGDTVVCVEGRLRID